MCNNCIFQASCLEWSCCFGVTAQCMLMFCYSRDPGDWQPFCSTYPLKHRRDKASAVFQLNECMDDHPIIITYAWNFSHFVNLGC